MTAETRVIIQRIASILDAKSRILENGWNDRFLSQFQTMATSPSSPNLLSPPNVYGNPFIGLTPLNEFDFQTFISHLLRTVSDTDQYKEGRKLSLIFLSYGITNDLMFAVVLLGLKKDIALGTRPELTLFRAIMTLTENTIARGSIDATSEYARDTDGSIVKIDGLELWRILFILYLSTGRPLKYFPIPGVVLDDSTVKFTEDDMTGFLLYYEDYFIILGTDDDDRQYLDAVNFSGPFKLIQIQSSPEVANVLKGNQKIIRAEPSSTVDLLFNEKGTALRHLKVYTDNAKTIDLTGYQWSMKNILKSLKGGFTDSTVTLSDNSKTYNVDRTILGMFSGYFNTAFKTQVGMGATINTAYRNEFESYLKYLSGQSNGMLDTSNFLNNFAFAQLIGDDYLTLTLIRQLGSDIASLDVTLDEIRKIDKMVGDYVSVIRL